MVSIASSNPFAMLEGRQAPGAPLKTKARKEKKEPKKEHKVLTLKQEPKKEEPKKEEPKKEAKKEEPKEEPTKDRHVDRSGKGDRERKGGSGKGGWTDDQAGAEGEGAATGDADAEEAEAAKPVDPEEAARLAEAALKKKEREDEAKQMTYEQYQASRKDKLVTTEHNVRKVAKPAMKNMTQVVKEEEPMFQIAKSAPKAAPKSAAPAKKGSKKEAPKAEAAPKVEKKADKKAGSEFIGFRMENPVTAPSGKGKGKGKGKGEGRGRGGEGRGRGFAPAAAAAAQAEFQADDESAFPSLS